MSTRYIEDPAKEQSTFIITVDFEDSAGAASVPKTVTWALRDPLGTVINSRSAVEVDGEELAASIDIELRGDDLALAAGVRRERRVMAVTWTNDTDHGDDREFNDEIWFEVAAMTGVA